MVYTKLEDTKLRLILSILTRSDLKCVTLIHPLVWLLPDTLVCCAQVKKISLDKCTGLSHKWSDDKNAWCFTSPAHLWPFFFENTKYVTICISLCSISQVFRCILHGHGCILEFANSADLFTLVVYTLSDIPYLPASIVCLFESCNLFQVPLFKVC